MASSFSTSSACRTPCRSRASARVAAAATRNGARVAPPPPGAGDRRPLLRGRHPTQDPLRLRSQPRISSPPTANVIAELPDGPRRPLDHQHCRQRGFIEASKRRFAAGCCSAASPPRASWCNCQRRRPGGGGRRAYGPCAPLPSGGIPAEGDAEPIRREPLTKRSAIWPARGPSGRDRTCREARALRPPTSRPSLRDDLAKIIAYLATDNPAHKRYRPRERPDLLQHLYPRLLRACRSLSAARLVDAARPWSQDPQARPGPDRRSSATRWTRCVPTICSAG